MNNVEDFYNYSWSAGAVSGFGYTDNGDGTYDIASGEVVLRDSASITAPLKTFAVSGVTGLTPTDGSTTYTYIDYNSGTPTIVDNGALGDFNCLDKCVIWKVAREGNRISFRDERRRNVDFNRKMRRRHLESNDFKYVSGGKISEVGTRNIYISQLI